MTDVDREAATKLMRRLRESRGWSWSDLARALRDVARRQVVVAVMNHQLSTIQRTIARWESAAGRTSPGERYQVLLAHLYANKSAGTVDLGPGSDFDTLMNALRLYGISAERIRQLAVLIAQSPPNDDADLGDLLPQSVRSGVMAALRDPKPLDSDLLSWLDQAVSAINRDVGSMPFVRLQLRVMPVVETCRQLLRSEGAGQQADFLLLAAGACALAARLAFETRNDAVAMALYAEAGRLAGRMNDRSHVAAVRTSHTMVVLHATDDLDAAMTIAKAGTDDAHRGASRARARAHAVHAEICARGGRADQAMAALERAWNTVDQLTLDDPHSGFDGGRPNGFEGLCAATRRLRRTGPQPAGSLRHQPGSPA